MSSRSRRQLEEWVRKLEVHGRVIDFGGSQNPIWKRGICDEKSVTVVDLYEPHEDAPYPDVAMDLNRLSTKLTRGDKGKKAVEESFDTAFCLEVMEYIWNPYQALMHIRSMLRKGGTLYISFHWLYGLHPPEHQDCLRYSEYAIEKLLRATGFEIIDMEVKEITPEGKQMLSRFYIEEGMRVDKYDRSLFDEGYLVKAIKV